MAAADMGSAPSPQPSYCDGTDHIQEIESFFFLAVLSMFLLNVLGSLRRRMRHGLLHAIVMGVYTLSYPLVSYTIGLMKSSDCYKEDFPVWAVFLLLLLGGTDSLTACHLNDIDSWKGIYLKHLFKGFLLVYVLSTIYDTSMVPYLPPLSAILIIVILKWYARIASMSSVSKSYLRKNVKVIAEYMQHKDNPVVPFNPVTMDGYRYIVAGEKCCVVNQQPGCTPWYKEHGCKVTTVEHIWQCKGTLLLHERGMLLRDVCLSMALSKMLNRRFASFKLSEAGLEKTHDFVFKGLLDGEERYQRVFRVVEEELVFFHDIYYTRYSYLYRKGQYLALCLPVIMIALCSWLTLTSMHVKHQYPHDSDHDMMGYTIFIIVVVAFLEAYQLYLYIASGWFKVAIIRSYVTTPYLQRKGCLLEKIIGLLLRLKGFGPWSSRLGQYCILQDHGRNSRLRNCLHYATLRLVDKAKKGCKKSEKLSENVKKAIVDSLLRSDGHLTNGVTSLQNNGVHGHLSWACDATAATDGAVTRTILIWHIATTLCCHKLDAQAKEEDTVRTACTLSRYCMHLLTFAPNLLPDHSSISESILDQSFDEAGELLKGAKTLDSKCEKLMKIGINYSDGHEARLLVQGARLAKHLIKDIEEPTLRWKVLCDFWAEMLLYVSPSNNARGHLESLAKGGEFITHLWAMLTHAGVLKRCPTGTNNV